jgi:hypothetical protein
MLEELATKRVQVFDTFNYDSEKFSMKGLKSRHFEVADKLYMSELFDSFSEVVRDPEDDNKTVGKVKESPPLLDRLREEYTWQHLPRCNYVSEAAALVTMQKEAAHQRPQVPPIVHKGYSEKQRKTDMAMEESLREEAKKELELSAPQIVATLMGSGKQSKAPTEQIQEHANLYAKEKVSREAESRRAPKQDEEQTVVVVGRALIGRGVSNLLHWQEGWANDVRERTWEEPEALTDETTEWKELQGEEVLVWFRYDHEPYVGTLAAHPDDCQLMIVSYTDGDTDYLDMGTLQAASLPLYYIG